MGHIRIAHGQSLATIKDYLLQENIDHILIVGSKRRCHETGVTAFLQTALPHLKIAQFSDFSPNPTFEEVWQGGALLVSSSAHLVLSVGGGTAMDIGKSLVALHQMKEETAKDMVQNGGAKLPPSKIPHIVLPTTAGSGSEATHFAVIYLGGRKYSLTSPYLRPTLSIIDGEMTRNMSSFLAASSAADALCQGIESYWAVSATEESRTYARQAITMLYRHMVSAVVERDSASQNLVAEAACLAGQAIDISKTTAAHAFSYYLTSRHDVPHGHAVSLCLPAVARNNYDAIEAGRATGELEQRFQELFSFVNVSDLGGFLKWFQDLMGTIGLEVRPETVGFSKTNDEENFMGSVNLERLANNPAKIDGRKFMAYFLQE